MKRYGVDALGSMALGLFSSLIIGLIMKEIGLRLNLEFLATFGVKAMSMVGAAIGVAVAYSLKAPPLVLFASVVTGFAGNELGGPAGAFFATALGAEFGKLVSKETKVDIIITPAVTIMVGSAVALFIGPTISWLMSGAGSIIMWATELLPIPMGILVSLLMGIILTLPVSSAALSIMLNLSGIAAGAACAGCSAQMVGFAVASYRENKLSGVLSQGLGTSMLQMPNIVRNPRIWVPACVASMVNGPISTAVFGMQNIKEGAGMGTSGLVGQFGTFTAMGFSVEVLLMILFVHIVIPAVVSLLVSEFMRKKHWIRFGDMKLEM